jgi:glycosyltransferase involved in cell wall biosynthesis
VTRLAIDRSWSHWIAVSKAVKESLKPLKWLPPPAIHVIWNGVDLNAFEPRPVRVNRSRPVIGVAARLAPMKGLHFLIDAMAELSRRGTACDLVIVGDGPCRHDLEARVKSRGLAQVVSFLGQCRDMPSFYHSIDVLALPSVALEGLPLSILEAMASGLPVVSTLLSGIPEVVADGVSGSLVRPGDVGALADALEPLLRSGALRSKMGQAGRERAEAVFSLERTVAQIKEVYGCLTIAA